MASARARMRWPCARACGPVAHAGSTPIPRGTVPSAASASFSLHERPPLGDAQDVPQRHPVRRLRHQAALDRDAGVAQPLQPAPADARIGILDARRRRAAMPAAMIASAHGGVTP